MPMWRGEAGGVCGEAVGGVLSGPHQNGDGMGHAVQGSVTGCLEGDMTVAFQYVHYILTL